VGKKALPTLSSYANFKDSVLKNVNLFGVDLSGADLTRTHFAGIKDKGRLKGLSESKHLDKAIFD
jgi:uncharacterized protein YjbI with pentapeptide repeats